MFDRAACGEARLTAAPYVGAAALSALRDLLRRALKHTSASSSAPLSGVSRTSRDQNRRGAHACQDNETPDEADGQSAGPAQQLDLFDDDRPTTIVDTPAWPELPAETRTTLTGLMVRLILEHAGANRPGSPREAGHDL